MGRVFVAAEEIIKEGGARLGARIFRAAFLV